MDSPVQVVLFDLDDTLFAHRAAVTAGILLHIDRAGEAFVTDDRPAATALWDALEEEHYHAYLAGSLDFAGQRRARAQDFAASFDIALTGPEADSWFDEYFESYRASWQLHDDALPCFDALAEMIPGVRFGLITNGDPVFQGDKIRRVGLDDRFEHVITSGAFGVAKPDRRIFEHACTLFDVPVDAAVYVGDRLRTDALGAAAAGLTGVWLDRAAPSVSSVDAASAARLGVLRIEKLADLCAVLA
ncbi:HAD family hydrolase [Cryobacterium sp. PH29-G1]|uniref:HAD family hydrolase n=1 Tax=Cryobacterium sp. PH29-G1 TaxID=3046211 RepID=UPI0024B93A0E|nr:HAD family hydrolase [Cryobacterium sp. PH29-G1]MDJ0348072.1 HAD family hydrolase [Cryobacterium sp. PH29-G1]